MKDIIEGVNSSSPIPLLDLGDKLLLRADDGSNGTLTGRELTADHEAPQTA